MFRPTHKITHNGRDILVMEEPGDIGQGSTLYTEAEWEACGRADWELNRVGGLLFQGQVPTGKWHYVKIG